MHVEARLSIAVTGPACSDRHCIGDHGDGLLDLGLSSKVVAEPMVDHEFPSAKDHGAVKR